MSDDGNSELVERVAEVMKATDRSVAVAESLTGGQLAAALASGPGASTWFRGGIVAYNPEVKFRLLDVERGPVVTRACAEQMARAVAELTGASITVAVTGVGGPDPEEGKPAGTVWLALCVEGSPRSERLQLDGNPGQVLAATVRRSLSVLAEAAEELGPAG